MATPKRRFGPKLKNSLLISLLAGNWGVETGSTWTASATTQSPQSLITETLQEKPALARPIGTRDFRYLVSGGTGYAEFGALSLAERILFLAP